MQAAVDALWPYVDGLFAGGVGRAGRSRACGRRGSPRWTGVLAEATLRRPARLPGPGRRPRDELVALLSEMQELHRAHPGARW